jgi:glutathione synthase/RimK-type ligase-like ATP-grasp enzyme
VILLVTNRDDLTADWLVIELQRRGVEYMRFNTEDFPARCRLRWTPEAATITVNNVTLASEDIGSVWFRRPVAPRIAPGLSAEEEAWSIREAATALDGFWRTLEARWVSPPEAIRHADSKPQQLSDARALGFELPDTEITDDREAVAALIARSRHGVVCKPLRDGRVRESDRSLFFTSQISLEDLKRDIETPHLFQALVVKRYDVRVTVIGEDVFAARIEADHDAEGRTDWRRAQPETLRYAVERLPEETAELCRRLVAGYGLSFGAIDLARRPDGGYTFFEINPNGQWAFIEQRVGLPLRARLADLLGDGERTRN